MNRVFFAALCATLSLPAFADSIPYPNVGTQAPQTNVYAASSAGLTVYFAKNGGAAQDFIEIVDPTTGYNSGEFFENLHTAPGTSMTVGAGHINQGDQVVIYLLRTFSPSPLVFASVASDSVDGFNHAYITSYAGGTYNSHTFPASFYVGLEDAPHASSDFDFNDVELFISGLSLTSTPAPSPVPEPSSLALVATGAAALLTRLRRRN
jgi:hypothetical protein